MTNTQIYPNGMAFWSYYADGRFAFTIIGNGTVNGERVYLAEMDDENYGNIVKAFTQREVQHAVGV